MEEHNSNPFSKWEEKLPSPDELTPLSQTLITQNLAIAFDITNPNSSINNSHSPPPPISADFESPGAGNESAKTLKRPRLVWTPQLHKRFVDAVAHLGIKNAVPKTIMQFMSVDGLTRENVASHLQKYRLYLKRMQGISGSSIGGAELVSDSPAERLFATSPVPQHFFANPDRFLQRHHQMAAVAAVHHRRQVDYFGSPDNGQFENLFLARPVHRTGAPVNNPARSYGEDLNSGDGTEGREVLTLFPTSND